MTVDWGNLALVIAMVVVACGASYFLLLRTLQRMLAENQRQMERRLASLTEAFLAYTPASQESAADALTAEEIELEASIARTDAVGKAERVADQSRQETQSEEEIAPEIQAAIAAAAIAALGNHARVRSARRVPSNDVVSPWTQQGRVTVQSSHNLRNQGSR